MKRQMKRRFSIDIAIGVLLLTARLSWSQNYLDFSSKPNVGRSLKANFLAGQTAVQTAPSYAAAAAPIFADDFNSGTLDLNKWRLGANPGNQSAVVNNALALRSQNFESGWVVTHNAYLARNTTVAIKVVQPNNDGALGMSPTYNLSSIYGLYNEANFYRFYTYRNTSSGAYLLYVEWKKNGVLNGFDVTGNLVINGVVYLRLRCDDTKIHFEASLDGVTWTDTYNETFTLPGYTLDTPFYYELAGYKTWALGTFVVDDFVLTSLSGTPSTLTLNSPNGGEWWFVGDTKQIEWSGTNSITNVKLEFSRDAGASWRTVVASSPNDGVYNWEVPDTVSNACMIRIADAANASIVDVSDGSFFVTSSAFVNFTPSPGNPVLSPGAPGSWDENIRERGWFMYENGTYHVWYGGWQGSYNLSTPKLVKLGYAYSTDGVNWTKYSGNPIYTQDWIEDMVIVKDGNTYYMYAEDEYTGDGDGALINLFTSIDKINWAKYGTVISPRGAGWEAHDVGTPTAWKEGNTWYMLYEGLGNGIAGQVGLVTSSDGKNWTRHPNNPVLSHPFNANLDIAIDSIVKSNGIYYAYGHYDIGGHNWVGGMFTSTNLITWTAYPGNPLPYNSPVLIDNGTNYFMYSLIFGTNGLAPYQLATSTHTTPPSDVTPPIISAVAATNVTSASATISWQTNEAADSQVEYGLTTSYGSSSPLVPALVTLHTVSLSSLQANTIYHYRVKSKDAAGNLATSGDFTFTTLSPLQPVISSFTPTSGPVGTQVMITGSNFTGTTSVAFNGTPAVNFTVVSDAQINFVVPAGATTGKISVTTAAGAATSAGNFTVIQTLTFGATDDAYVQSSTPAKNYGNASDLRVKKSSPTQNAYLKFNVTGLSGSVQRARLRLYVADASNDGGAVYQVANYYSGTNTAWTETGLKWNNAPAISGSPLASAGAVSVAQTIELEVTPAISGNGVYSFALKNNSTNAVYYQSRQGANVPVLVIQSAVGAAVVATTENAIGVEKSSSILRAVEMPERFALYPNYPNPFRLSAFQTETRLVYQLPERAHVKLTLYDLLGREIMVLINEEREAGTYEARWNGRDVGGNLLPSGTYIYTLQARDFSSSNKLLLVK